MDGVERGRAPRCRRQPAAEEGKPGEPEQDRRHRRDSPGGERDDCAWREAARISNVRHGGAPMKRRGRPPLDSTGNPSTKVQLRLTSADYDRLYQLSRQKREHVNDLIRRGVRRLLEGNSGT